MSEHSHRRIEPQLDPAALAVPPRQRLMPRLPPVQGRWGRRLVWSLLFLFLLPPIMVLMLRWVPPPTTAFMLQSPAPVDYRWVPAARIADSARRAAVAAEDQKFWMHNGFDLEAIEKAYAQNKKSRRRRGASTISQQVAKNLFLWSGGGYFRKGIEVTFTVLIEALWSKERILEMYLNIAEFGSGIYGVEAAAQKFFGKSANALSNYEAAQLAAVLPSPRRWKVRAPGPYVQTRVQWILRQMGARRAVGVENPETVHEPEPELPPELEPDLAVDSGTEPSPAPDAAVESSAEPQVQPEPAEQADLEAPQETPPAPEEPAAGPEADPAAP